MQHQSLYSETLVMSFGPSEGAPMSFKSKANAFGCHRITKALSITLPLNKT